MGSQRIELDTDHRVSRVWPLLELLYDTTLGQHFLGDGFTPGGIQPDAAQPDPYVFSVDDIPDGGIPAAKLGASSVTTAALASGSVTDGVLAPNVLRKHVTRAALFEPGIAGSMQRCSFSFDPTNTTDLTIRFKRRGLSNPALSELRVLCGVWAADRPVVVYRNNGGTLQVEMRENSISLLTYAWTDDQEEHEWSFDYQSTGCTITLDGAIVATGVVAPTFLTTSSNFFLAHHASAGTVFEGDHATYRDFEVIDPATATNKVYLRLDEGAGGPYRNAYLALGDPLYDATNTSAVTVATTGTDTSRPKSAEVLGLSGGAAPVIAGGGTRHTRVAAFGGLGDAATGGPFGTVAWAPTGTPAFNVEFDCRRSLTQAGDVLVWGNQAPDYPNVNVSAAGVVQARVNAVNICTSTVAALPPSGRTPRVRVEFRDSGADVTAAIYVDRRLVASGTLAATQFSAVPANFTVGARSGANRRWSGSIFNLLIEDLNSAANSGFYLMDEPVTATTYANTYPGSSLAALTKNGYVGVSAVESEDGRGMPWQFGSGSGLVYDLIRTVTPAVMDGSVSSSHTITFSTEVSDPTGSVSSSILTVPCAGKLLVDANLTFFDSTAENLTLDAQINSNTTNPMDWAQPATTELQRSYVGSLDVVAGDLVRLRLSGIDAGNTAVAHKQSRCRLTLFPNPIAG